MLAWTRNSGESEPQSGISGHLFIGLLLVGFALATTIAVITTRHHHH
jgi:hypothetical protein